MPKGQYTSQFGRGNRWRPRSLAERFWEKVEQGAEDECWIWIGAIFRNTLGYGQIQMGGRPHLAHRVSWLLANGPVPDGSQVLHRCDVAPCVNPAHLFLGDRSANMKDMVAKGRWNGNRNGVAGDRNGTRTKPQSRPRGETHSRAVLTEEIVREMRRLHRGGTPQVRLVERYGVNKSVVSKVVRRRTWAHVSD